MAKQKKHPKQKKPRIGRKALVAGILNVFAENPVATYNYKQIAFAVGARDQAAKNLVKQILNELIEKEELNEFGRGKYKINPEKFHEHTSSK